LRGFYKLLPVLAEGADADEHFYKEVEFVPTGFKVPATKLQQLATRGRGPPGRLVRYEIAGWGADFALVWKAMWQTRRRLRCLVCDLNGSIASQLQVCIACRLSFSCRIGVGCSLRAVSKNAAVSSRRMGFAGGRWTKTASRSC
jgi:hypothetical protein